MYHLAWNGSSGNDRNDFDMQYSNIKYTVEAIKLAKRCNCKKFIGAGSQAEYGVVHGEAKEDETICKPFMMYGAAKLSAYQKWESLWQSKKEYHLYGQESIVYMAWEKMKVHLYLI